MNMSHLSIFMPGTEGVVSLSVNVFSDSGGKNQKNSGACRIRGVNNKTAFPKSEKRF